MRQTIIEINTHFLLVEYDEEIVSMANKIKNIDVDYIYSRCFGKNYYLELCGFYDYRNTEIKFVVKKQKTC